MEKRGNETKYILLELLAICFVASAGIFVKFSKLPPVNTGFWRSVFAIPCLLPLAWKHLKGLSRRDIGLMLLAGVFFAGDITLFSISLTRTSIANTNLITNLTPFTVVPVSYFVFKERIPKHFFTALLIATTGLVILVSGKSSPTPSNYVGDIMALFASFFYAGYLLFSYRLRDRLPSNVILFVSSISAAITMAVSSALIEGGIQVPRSFDELWPILALTLFLQVIGHNLISHCSGKLSVNLSTAVSLCQPAIAALYSFFIFNETLSPMEIAGIAVVVMGVYLVKRQYTSKSAHHRIFSRAKKA